jgi:hypothetical protein
MTTIQRSTQGPSRRGLIAAGSITALPVAILLMPVEASAQSGAVSGPSARPAEIPDRTAAEHDPTGGAFTTPTLLFTPAASVPAWTARATTSLDVMGPTAPDRLALSNASLGFRPGLGGEVGLPLGFTFGGGTNWVGGDVSPTPISGGLSPYFQVRFQLYGAPDGHGLLLGTSTVYKFVGFQGDPGEMEWAISAQVRMPRYEVGLQAVLGKDLASTDADTEVHAYALYRIIPELGLGAAGQARFGIVSEPDESRSDVRGGAIASLTISRWQVAALGGATTAGSDVARVGTLGEVFATVRF